MRAPHPALRRLFACGSSPERVIERLATSLNVIARFERGLGDQEWLTGAAIDALLRPLDLSGLAHKAAILERAERSSEAAVVPHAPRRPASQVPSVAGRADSAIAPSSARAVADDPSEVARLLRVYAPAGAGAGAGVSTQSRRREIEAALDAQLGHRNGPIGSAAVVESRQGIAAVGMVTRAVAGADAPTMADDSGMRSRGAIRSAESARGRRMPPAVGKPSERSAGDQTSEGAHAPMRLATSAISRDDAARWVRHRAVLAGDSAAADMPIADRGANIEAQEILRRTLTEIHEGTGSGARQNPPPSRSLDTIARIGRAIDTLQTAPRERSRAIGQHDAAIAGRATETRHGIAAEDTVASEIASGVEPVGLRGLAARAARSRRGLEIERPAASADSNDFAYRLDALLKREARRQGIDLEETER